ncbi:unnamed protein product [Thelazia callipaeda]|uniref:Transthyretin-like family protein n=1 Tax=Thelazia callipaeda TaxID=103827 RepID=A0A0N5CPC6_THECL|nr:unnamed protein product [Thelazia callipaeda]
MNILQIIALLGFAAFCVNAGIIGSIQGITVVGRLACGTKSVQDQEVQLWEEDSGDPDDLLNTTRSDHKGNFKVFGQDKEVTAIEPYLSIKHSCENGVINPKCSITDEYLVPKEFIGKTYEMGIVSLSIARKNHKKKYFAIMLLNFLILSELAVASTFALGSIKNITVTGQIACSDRSLRNVEIQLWEHDTFDPDDLLKTTKSDHRGHFEIYGEEDEINNIEPYLVIVHNCDNGATNLFNKSKMYNKGSLRYTDQLRRPCLSDGHCEPKYCQKSAKAMCLKLAILMTSNVLFLLTLFGYHLALNAICTTKNVTITGQLGCGDRALKNVELELRERDTNLFLAVDPDDILNGTTSDSEGHFALYGEECEIGTIEPYLRIYHNCNDGALSKDCVITDEFDVPQDLIGGVYNMGIISLNIARKNHRKICRLCQKSMLVLLLFLHFELANSFFFIGKEQRVTVTGSIGCDDNAHDRDVYIELWEQDFGTVNMRCTVVDYFPIPAESINKVYRMGIVSLNIYHKNRKTRCKERTRKWRED